MHVEANAPQVAPSKWKLRLLSVLAGTVAGLLLVEMLLQVFNIEPEYNIMCGEIFRRVDDPELIFDIAPNMPHGDDMTSSAGLRDREFEPRKPDGVYRIAMVGDSVTFGLGCTQEESYPKQLESILNSCTAGNPAVGDAAPVKFEVMNFGVIGYSAMQVARQVETRIPEFEPDLIIYSYVMNDPQAVSINVEMLERYEDAARFGQRDAFLRPLNKILHRLHIFRYARYWTLGVPDHLTGGFSDPAYKALFDGRHSEFIHALHDGDSWRAVQDAIQSISGQSVPVQLALFPTRMCFVRPEGESTLRDLRELVLSEASDGGMLTLDLLPSYIAARPHEKGRLFIDYLHPNPLGNRIAAVAVLADLARRGRPPFNTIDFACVIDGDERLQAAYDAVVSKEPAP